MDAILEPIKTLIIVPFGELLLHVAGYIPTLISALVVLVVGIALARLIQDVGNRIFKEIHIDKIAEQVGLAGILHQNGVKPKVGDLMSGLLYLVVILTFLMMTLSVTGVSATVELMDQLIAYFPSVLAAVFVLAIGLILAKIVGSIIFVVASHVHLPQPNLLKTMTHWAIIFYAAKMTIAILGYGYLLEGVSFYIILTGVVLALTLRYGFSNGAVINTSGKM